MRPDQATWPEAGFADFHIDTHHLRHFLRAAGTHHRGRGRGDQRSWDGPRGFVPGGGFPGGRGFPWGGGHRAGRGDIRAAILALLSEEPMHGYQVIQELERRTGGRWRPSPGSVYPTLQQLEDEGLVRAVEPEAGRRAFELTDAGREEASASTGPPPWEEVAGGDNDGSSTWELFRQVGGATWQVTRAGSPKQVTQAAEILRDARRRLYQLLAEDSE
ncbi:MAG: PadR family transcriptional regulator [Candidatus Dormibacteraeota bacterium]|nr:PadR family transcriptional regulator [Candidatus Dormibacteraeota bacterium]